MIYSERGIDTSAPTARAGEYRIGSQAKGAGHHQPAPPTDAISRADTREKFSLAGSSITYEALSNDYSGSEMSSYIMHVPAGYQSETVSHEGEEIIYMLEGQVEWTLDGQRFTMNVGDSLHYSGTVPHAWSNPNDTPARILWTGTLSVLSPDDQRRLPPATIEGEG